MQASEDNQPSDSAKAMDGLGTSEEGSGGHVTDPKDSEGRCMSSEGLMVQGTSPVIAKGQTVGSADLNSQEVGEDNKRRGTEGHNGTDDQVGMACVRQVSIKCVMRRRRGEQLCNGFTLP